MVSFEPREDRLPTDQEGLFRYEEIPLKGKRLKSYVGRKWIHATLKQWPHDVNELEIACRILDDDLGCIGIWTPSEDYHSKANIGPRVHGITGKVFLEPESWTFGNEASLTLHRLESNIQSEIDVSILCRPYELTGDVKIELNLFSKHQGERFGDAIYSEIFEFSKKKKDTRKDIYRMKEEYEIFDIYEAYVVSGRGNIVHPKQICTIKGLEYLLKEISSKQISISYIGTDTSENLTSVLRWLKESDNWSRISSFHILYTDKWDSKFFDFLPDYHPAKMESEIVKSDKITPKLVKNLSESDVVIATYVTPFVDRGADNDINDKGSYGELLDKILGKESILLSVDPISAESSVKSILIDSVINCDSYYAAKLKLELDNDNDYDNNSVKWTTWRRSENWERKESSGSEEHD